MLLIFTETALKNLLIFLILMLQLINYLKPLTSLYKNDYQRTDKDS